MTQTIEQLQAKVAELEEENARLNLLFVKAAKGKGENLKECFSLQQQLAKAEQRVAEACIALIEDRLGELDGQDSEWAAGQVGAIGEIADGGWRKFVKEV